MTLETTATKVCKVCGKELPLNSFRRNMHGVTAVCNECAKEKYRNTIYNRTKPVIKDKPISDPDFDNQFPGDVWRMMCRAKRWLESRGYSIKLDGEYREVKVKKLKFE